MQRVIGIDPSQRHTGLAELCYGSTPVFHEIQPKGDVLSSGRQIEAELDNFLANHAEPGTLYGIEKQLSVGGQTSSLMFYIQMVVLDTIGRFHVEKFQVDPVFVMPLPVQLKSYMKKRHGFDTAKPSTIVQSFKEKYEKTPWANGRISQHKVDAFMVGQLALDVMEGSWSYPLPSRESALIPWKIVCQQP